MIHRVLKISIALEATIQRGEERVLGVLQNFSNAEMMKIMWLLGLFLLCSVGVTGAGQEIAHFLHLYDTTSTPEVLRAMPHSAHSLAVSVSGEDLNAVSKSVLKTESWLRTHVLVYFPATKITTIVVGTNNNLLCQNGENHDLGLILPSLKNIFHSLTRWDLERDIKVSVVFPLDCFAPNSAIFREDVVEKVTKPVLEFLFATNSTLCVSLHPKISHLSDETMGLVASHTELVRKIGPFELNRINVIFTNTEQQKSMGRKLSTSDSKFVNPYPARPTPLPETSQPPLHPSMGFSVPANIAKKPLPPLAHVYAPPPLSFPVDFPPPFSYPGASPPPMTFPFAPEQPPFMGPVNAPHGYSLPPCSPAETMPPAPGTVQKLWCVAKPSVPAEALQEAMDYACGEGGADCEEIRPHGSCFYPDTVVAHASYAFNSYWQKAKRNGGTCNFGGTAMIINSDPSFLHCRFVLGLIQ